MTIAEQVAQIAHEARQASFVLSRLSTRVKNELLLAIPLLLLNFLLTFATRRAGWLVMGLLLAAYAMTQAALLLQDRLLAS